MLQRTPFTLDRVVRLIITLAVIFGMIWLINILKDVLLPFLVACIIAYMFEPFVQHNRRLLRLKGRVSAVFITLFEALFFLSIILYFLVPMIGSELKDMSAIMKTYASSKISVKFLPDEVQHLLRESFDFHRIGDMFAQQDWMPVVTDTLRATWEVLTSGWSVILGIVSWLIVILYVVFIMIDYEKLERGFKSMIPKKMQPLASSITHDIVNNMNRYFRGQALIAFLVGIMFAIGFAIVGLPMAIMLGLFIGLLNLVPYLQIISIVPTAVLCLVYAVGGGGDFWTLFGECVLVYFVVQAIQDLFLTPKIMGKAMGLNPAIILLSLSVWGTLLGFIGLIIALPLTTLLISYYRHFIVEGIDNRDDGLQGATRGDLDAFDSMVDGR
ncbi:MAG: AI-2E family transporter [Paramuribaculum sp.]|nr:AI-2E family transporter [Paramuribaculum sp.]MDE6324290.1 AI-2E family transporter [Paramuribaculum sp.]MDE6487766.1 AI-2E family transporter [Paramuribaculum sp.]